MKVYHRALTIAGSDSGGGAGIQADLKTFSALGCYGTSVLTALTAQNTVAVTAIHAPPPAFVAAQIDAVLGDIGTDATKIGMLHSAPVIEVVAERLGHHEPGPVVLDPVMVTTSGDRLLQEDAVEALRARLLPLATVITPNLAEALALLGGGAIDSPAQMEAAARELAATASAAVLITGGHLAGDHSVDVLYDPRRDEIHTFDAARIDTPNTHGTGCTLSSAVAAHLARGETLTRSVQRAKVYMTDAIRAGAGLRLGHGRGPVHHFFDAWR